MDITNKLSELKKAKEELDKAQKNYNTLKGEIRDILKELDLDLTDFPTRYDWSSSQTISIKSFTFPLTTPIGTVQITGTSTVI